jgi:hypothetical protein
LGSKDSGTRVGNLRIVQGKDYLLDRVLRQGLQGLGGLPGIGNKCQVVTHPGQQEGIHG